MNQFKSIRPAVKIKVGENCSENMKRIVAEILEGSKQMKSPYMNVEKNTNAICFF